MMNDNYYYDWESDDDFYDFMNEDWGYDDPDDYYPWDFLWYLGEDMDDYGY